MKSIPASHPASVRDPNAFVPDSVVLEDHIRACVDYRLSIQAAKRTSQAFLAVAGSVSRGAGVDKRGYIFTLR